MWVLSLAAFFGVACGEDPADEDDNGEQVENGENGNGDTRPVAESTPIGLIGWSPMVSVSTLGEPAMDFLLDTGSPVTVLDTNTYAGAAGVVEATLEMLGGSWPVSAARFEFFSPPPPGATLTVGGLVGGDALIGRRLVIDYQNAWGYLFDGEDDSHRVYAEVGPTIEAPFDRLGGGRFSIPGDGSMDVPATRLVVPVTVEGRSVDAVIDTGATHSTMDPALFSELGDASRPRLEGVRVGQAGGVVEATLTRVSSLAVGEASVSGATVIVLPDGNVFRGLENELGVEVGLLLGATYLRYYLMTLDYHGGLMGLARFLDDGHVNPREWIGPGFRVTNGPGGDLIVADVYDDTDAYTKGVRRGDRIARLDGMDTRDLGLEGFRQMVTTYAVGSQVAIGFRELDEGEVTDIEILIENLLPVYP